MSAFSALYRSHVGVVTQAIRDNVHDPETVADVTQEVFARALERLGTLRDTDRFRPWLMSIAAMRPSTSAGGGLAHPTPSTTATKNQRTPAPDRTRSPS